MQALKSIYGKSCLLKAILYYKYGSPGVLRLEEVAMPSPTDDEVLIKVHAVSHSQTGRR
jgi:NADPH:quinone reductase-like Zn-dependent oxidoreductase